MAKVTSTNIPDTCASPQGAKKRRGFAAMDKKKQRELASKGGKAAHAKGTAHEFDREEARLAGKKGGFSVSRNREHMAEIGSRGGSSKADKFRMKKILEEGAPPSSKMVEKEVDRTNRY